MKAMKGGRGLVTAKQRVSVIPEIPLRTKTSIQLLLCEVEIGILILSAQNEPKHQSLLYCLLNSE